MRMSIVDQLDSIFGIPKDGSNIKEEADESQETSYADAINDKEIDSFEQKANALQKVLAKDAPPQNVEYISKEDSNVTEQKAKQTQAVESQKAEANTGSKKESSKGEASFEKILTQAIRPNEPVSVEILPVVQKQTVNNQTADVHEDDSDEDTQRTTVTNEYSQSEVNNQKPDQQGWLLASPSPMFNHFYTQKGMLIMSITRNGSQLPIDQMLAELKSSYVNTNVELSDLQGMYDKLSEIQNFLDRVVQIKILATGQCSATKRGVELLRGVLAKVCYEKPAARQDGVNYDHMRDIEMYACRVESLEQSAKDVYHNLLEAKEILSRKISVAIELFKQQHMGDTIEKTYNNLPINVKHAIQSAEKVETKSLSQKDGFDKLEVQEVVKNNTKIEKTPMKKSGQTDWFD